MPSDNPPPGLSAETKARRARSFGRAAEQYDLYRPGPPLEAVAWLLPEPVKTVVDLGAGTGALTRLLVGLAEEVVAVEPDKGMRAVLSSAVPGAGVLEGRGEAIPMPDRSVDAVVASSSWHWVDPVTGLEEVARVLRPGGVLGALWTGPDRGGAFVATALELLGGVGADDPGGEGVAETVRAMSDDPVLTNSVLRIPEGLPFAEPDYDVFLWDMALTADDLVGLLSTLSWVILMEPDAREALLGTARRLLREALGVAGDVTVDVGFRCDAYRTSLVG